MAEKLNTALPFFSNFTALPTAFLVTLNTPTLRSLVNAAAASGVWPLTAAVCVLTAS